jgi:Holliday junction resolvase RusA-like endonuclease
MPDREHKKGGEGMSRQAKHYYITPIPKPRMTRRDKWACRPAAVKYFEFCNQVKAAGVELPEHGAVITFYIPMPPSWSKKKRKAMNMTPHQQTPDLDNLLKALSDAVHDEDCRIWHYGEVMKLWAEAGGFSVGAK